MHHEENSKEHPVDPPHPVILSKKSLFTIFVVFLLLLVFAVGDRDRIIPFLTSVLASMLEPFTLIGCVAAGSLMARLWQSLALATVWAMFVQVWIIIPRVKALQWDYGANMLGAALLAAWLLTALVYFLSRRKPRSE